MNSKKAFIVVRGILAAIAVIMFAASCSSSSKKNDPKPEVKVNLVASWKLTSATLKKNDGSTLVMNSQDQLSAFLLGSATFNADHTVTITDFPDKRFPWTGDSNVAVGGTINIDFSEIKSQAGGQLKATVASIAADGNSFTLSATGAQPDYSAVFTEASETMVKN